MSIADWISSILAFSVTGAAIEGSFMKPSSCWFGCGIPAGGLAVSSPGGVVRATFEICVASRDRGFLIIFFAS